MKLYWNPGSCSLAPHVALEETRRRFEAVKVDLAGGDQHAPWFLAINPRGRVPALELEDGTVITEVPAVLATIANWSPRAALLPPLYEAAARGRALEWLAWLSSSVHVAYAQIWRPERFLGPDDDPAALKAGGRRNVEACYAEIEERLAGPWALGERYSAVDPFLLVFYRWGERIGLDMAVRYRRWTAHTDAMLARPAVQRAMHREGITLLRAGSIEAA